MAENIIVHYDKDEADERCSAVVVRIDRAEFVLKPLRGGHSGKVRPETGGRAAERR